MIGCLFRLTEVDGGSIEIDGINIAKVRWTAHYEAEHDMWCR